MPPEGDYVIPTPTQEELDLLASQLVLIDPERKGITMNKLRVFYPKLGWGHIQARFNALKEAGRVTRKLRTENGSAVAFEFWRVVE